MSRFSRFATVPRLLLLGLFALAAACSGGPGESYRVLLAQAQFEGSAPGPALLTIVEPPADPSKPWEVVGKIEDPENNVFHKAVPYELDGVKGILTIGGGKDPAKGRLVFWPGGTGESPRVLGEWSFGGTFNRLRDLEIGDVDGDGADEMVIATHNQGVVLVVEPSDGFSATEIDQKPEGQDSYFVHEIELGDTDGDGQLEIFATPSEPNVLDGSRDQQGAITLYRFRDGEYERTLVEHFSTRHVKEVTVFDHDGDGTPTLFAAVEASNKTREGSAVRIYEWKDGELVGRDLVDLPGRLCRFLTGGDTDGDGQNELLASTMSSGIWKLWPKEGDTWTKRRIARPSHTGGFEHATIIYDIDGDGDDDVLAVADTKKKLQWFRDKGDTYERIEAMPIEIEGFTWNVERIPKSYFE